MALSLEIKPIEALDNDDKVLFIFADGSYTLGRRKAVFDGYYYLDDGWISLRNEPIAFIHIPQRFDISEFKNGS